MSTPEEAVRGTGGIKIYVLIRTDVTWEACVPRNSVRSPTPDKRASQGRYSVRSFGKCSWGPRIVANSKTCYLFSMTPQSDIHTSADVKRLVDCFYEKVNHDPLLAPIFNDFAQVDWPEHLPTMYKFWESLLLGSGTYQGAPFPKHMGLPVSQEHFERWLTLFVATVRENFSGPKALEAIGRAASIADTFARRLNVLTDTAAFGRIAFS